MAMEARRDMPGSELERYQEQAPTGALALPEHTVDRIFRFAHAYSRTKMVPECYQGEKGEPALATVGLTLAGLGVDFSPVTIKQTWIDPDAKYQAINLMAQLSIGIAQGRGYEVWFGEGDVTDKAATVSVQKRGSNRVDRYTYTIDMARRYGLLNEWVETRVQDGVWEDSGRPKYRTTRTVVAIDGQKIEGFDRLPEDIRKAYEAGNVKRKDTWFKAREQMLMARAATMALKVVAAGALLGIGDALDTGDIPDVASPACAPVGARPAGPPPGVDPDTGEIIGDPDNEPIDAEIVEERGKEAAPGSVATSASANEASAGAEASAASSAPVLADEVDRAALRVAFTDLPNDDLKNLALRQLSARGISLKSPDLTQEEAEDGLRLVRNLQENYDRQQAKKPAEAEQASLDDAQEYPPGEEPF